MIQLSMWSFSCTNQIVEFISKVGEKKNDIFGKAPVAQNNLNSNLNVNKLPNNEIIEYIKLIPDRDIRDEAILDNINRIENFQQKNILIDQAQNINFKSFLMRDSVRFIHNLQKVKKI